MDRALSSIDAPSLKPIMTQLAHECGGPDRGGVHEFVPHCTLLYNVDLRRSSSSLLCRAMNDTEAMKRMERAGNVRV